MAGNCANLSCPQPKPVTQTRSQFQFESANFRQSLMATQFSQGTHAVFVYLIVARDSLISSSRGGGGRESGSGARAVRQLSLNVIFKPVVSAHMGHKKGLASPYPLSTPSPPPPLLPFYMRTVQAQKHLVFIVKLVGFIKLVLRLAMFLLCYAIYPNECVCECVCVCGCATKFEAFPLRTPLPAFLPSPSPTSMSRATTTICNICRTSRKYFCQAGRGAWLRLTHSKALQHHSK